MAEGAGNLGGTSSAGIAADIARQTQLTLANINQSVDNNSTSLIAALTALNTTLAAVLPAVQSTATTATAGTNGAVPAQVLGYAVATVNGVTVKFPYFSV